MTAQQKLNGLPSIIDAVLSSKPNGGLLVSFVLGQSIVTTEQVASLLGEGEKTATEVEDEIAVHAIKKIELPEYSEQRILLVLLSQASDALSYADLNALWKELKLPKPFSETAEDAFLFLAKHGFLVAVTISETAYFSLFPSCDRALTISQDDCRNANIAFANFYGQKDLSPGLSEGLRTRNMHNHLRRAGLMQEAIQLVTATAPKLIELTCYEDAKAMLLQAEKDAEKIPELHLMIQMQLASLAMIQHEVHEATTRLESMLAYLDESKNEIMALATRNQLASIYLTNGQMKKAHHTLQDILSAQEKMKNVSGIAFACAQLGAYMHHTKNDLESVKHFYIASLLSSHLSGEEAAMHSQNFQFIQQELGQREFENFMSLVKSSAESYVSAYV